MSRLRIPISIALVFVSLVNAGLCARPAPQASDDQRAIDAYRAGDFETARTAWLALLEPSDRGLSDSERGRILYNLGNTAFRSAALLEAVGWYTSALRVRPRDADTWINLEHARSAAKLEPADRGDLSATLHRLLTSLTLSESEWLLLAALCVWAVVLAFEALRGGIIWRRLAIACALAVAIAALPWIDHLTQIGRDPVLAIEGDKIEIHSEPRADAPVIGEIAAGEQAERTDELPDWIKVSVKGGVSGWVGRTSVFVLER